MIQVPSGWIPREARRDHPERRRMRTSQARFKWCAAGRRSGKTLDGIGYILVGHGPVGSDGQPRFRGALNPEPRIADPTYVVAAPTRDMVRKLWWLPISTRLRQSGWVARENKTDLELNLVNGSRILFLSMEKPTRAEGIPIDGLVGDEFAYWRQEAYDRSLRPALSTRGRAPGWAILMGKPAGRNHFFEGWSKAKENPSRLRDAFHWTSAEIVHPREIEEARRTLDPRSFQQEYEASFLTQAGRVFYQWDESVHLRETRYDPNLPLVFCFDFNVSPGAAVVCQEQFYTATNGKQTQATVVLREYYVADDNNAPAMCRALASYYPQHKQSVFVYGDAGGYQRRTSAQSTDWDIVTTELKKSFGDVRIRVPHRAPSVIDSVNAVNARLLSSDGTVRLFVDSSSAPETRRDFEGVVWDEKKSDRDIDKKDMRRTHWADAIRYYISEQFPISGGPMVVY